MLRNTAADLIFRDPYHASTDPAEVLAFVATLAPVKVVDLDSIGGELAIYRVEQEDGPHVAIAVVITAQERLDYAAVLYF
jgi:hypothetical protein